ncbi:MAG TPA: prepilin-type N-terminal cleavage/methylation domain-containing protein [Candidatus Paceibacterota bacterium]|nr:prepilin-type N-terminal cleavage/methylation domain-containing protein [Candidatus Paceibacterota bacterium]
MRRKKGFTLIELLVVISIIGLLSSVVLAALTTARMKARDARRLADLDQIKIALELFYDSKGYYPQSGCGWNCSGYRYSFNATWAAFATDTAPYISRVPVDPLNTACAVWSGPTCYSYAYGNVGTTSTPPTYDLITRLETPGDTRACPAYAHRYGKGAGFIDNLCAYGVGLYNAMPN